MQKPEIWKMVLAYVMPSKSEVTTNDWRTYVNRYLVPEVHQEAQRFYGNLDSEEALYPGMDYASPAHRLRLTAYSRHKQLFAIFDKLRLTTAEIQALCRWDGTKADKQNYERRMRRKVKDTTWDGVHPYVKLPPISTLTLAGSKTTDSYEQTPIKESEVAVEDEAVGDLEAEGTSEDESEDEVEQSVGVSLNQRLLAATEARARGEHAPFDADWERWMHEAMERGTPDQTRLLPRVPANTGHQPLGQHPQAYPQGHSNYSSGSLFDLIGSHPSNQAYQPPYPPSNAPYVPPPVRRPFMGGVYHHGNVRVGSASAQVQFTPSATPHYSTAAMAAPRVARPQASVPSPIVRS